MLIFYKVGMFEAATENKRGDSKWRIEDPRSIDQVRRYRHILSIYEPLNKLNIDFMKRENYIPLGQKTYRKQI